VLIINIPQTNNAEVMVKTLGIDSLKTRITKLSGIQCDYYSEACVVLLEELTHSSGVFMYVDGDVSGSYSLLWSLKPVLGGWKQKQKLVENAATAIAFLLVAEETDYTVIEEASIGTGVDYWLGYKEGHALYDEDNFMNARLEISGIRDDLTKIKGRVNTKLRQVTPTDSTGLPAYVVVAEFGTPTAVLVRK
jgi:hypothetical protein